jgi:hypothetical protein
MALVLEEKVIIARDKFDNYNFGMDTVNPTPRVKLPQDLNAVPDECDKIFRKNFVSRCPLAQGFSSITLTLLHECGHWTTRSVLDMIEYDKMHRKVHSQEEYMEIPWEHLATEWAICWLHSPVNRRIAKEFEKNYFGYGKE